MFPLDIFLILWEFKRITNNQQIIKNYNMLPNSWKEANEPKICLNITNVNSQPFKLPHRIRCLPMRTLHFSFTEVTPSSGSCQLRGPAPLKLAGPAAARSWRSPLREQKVMSERGCECRCNLKSVSDWHQIPYASSKWNSLQSQELCILLEYGVNLMCHQL